MSRTEEDEIFLDHVIECIGLIEEYTDGWSKDRFTDSRLVRDAVIRNLQVLAESTTRLTDDIKGTEPSVPWAKIKAFRNRLTHGYLAVDLDTVWEVVKQDLPGLNDAIHRMRESLIDAPRRKPAPPDR